MPWDADALSHSKPPIRFSYFLSVTLQSNHPPRLHASAEGPETLARAFRKAVCILRRLEYYYVIHNTPRGIEHPAFANGPQDRKPQGSRELRQLPICGIDITLHLRSFLKVAVTLT